MANIVLDCMAGDNSPVAHVKGAVLALRDTDDLNLILVGKNVEILQELKKYKYDKNRVSIVEAKDIIYPNDEPVRSIRTKNQSSLVVALNEIVKENYDAIISTGNSGAFLAGCLFIVGKIKGIDRPALAPIINREHGRFVLLDVGANVDCDAENLVQFAEFGRLYYKILFNEENPSVKLLNIGTEENKGNTVVKKAYEKLSVKKDINFMGNVEARDIFSDDSHVIVCDGFVGNVVLKTIEGTSKYLLSSGVRCMSNNFLYRMIKVSFSSLLSKFKDRYDYQKYGGAIFLGAKKLCIKSHGNSNEIAIKNSIVTAYELTNKGFISSLEKFYL